MQNFKDLYFNLGVPVWPALGNHDYQIMFSPNNDCGAVSWENYKYCAADMAQFIAEWQLSAAGLTSTDARVTENAGQLLPWKNVYGTLAYSWEINKFHFVQMNNYPDYQVQFTRGYSSGVSSWNINIYPSISNGVPGTWLASDLQTAIKNNKKIILNWHIWDEYYLANPTARQNLITVLQPYATSIKAIFVGHIHSRVGVLDSLQVGGISIPIIYCGSAIYGLFNKVDFIIRNGACQINLQSINTYRSTNTSLSILNSRSLPC